MIKYIWSTILEAMFYAEGAYVVLCFLIVILHRVIVFDEPCGRVLKGKYLVEFAYTGMLLVSCDIFF